MEAFRGGMSVSVNFAGAGVFNVLDWTGEEVRSEE